MKQLRDRAQREIDRLDEVWSTFKSLKVQDLMGDELLYREMKTWFGKYFEGHMGATAIQKRLQDFDIAQEVENLRETIATRSEEHTSELQSLMRISYAVFCLKKK